MPDQQPGRVAQAIKAVRQARGFSQGQVAAWLGLTPVAYGHYERGRTPFTADQLAILASRLRVPVAYFFGERTDEDVMDAELAEALRGQPPAVRERARRVLRALLDEAEADETTHGHKAE